VSLSAASQLSQAELEELLAENAKLKQLLNSYAHKLSPEQVGGESMRNSGWLDVLACWCRISQVFMSWHLLVSAEFATTDTHTCSAWSR
jgi:hypothetical protein